MGFVSRAKNVLSLGGHELLESAKSAYQTSYQKYQSTVDWVATWKLKAEAELARLGNETNSSMATLRSSIRLLSALREQQREHLATATGSMPSLPRVVDANSAIAKFDSSISIASGAGIGAAAATGSWALVALVGSTSTGTSISVLSGAAAYNATMAWFGGGALAAGGAGMAGGAMMLTGIAIVPFIAFSAWSTRKKAQEIDQERAKVEKADEDARAAVKKLRSFVPVVESAYTVLREAHFELWYAERRAKQMLYPYGLGSKIIRWAKRMVGRGRLTDAEISALVELEDEVRKFSAMFCR